MARPQKNPNKLALEKGKLYGKQATRSDNLPVIGSKPKCPKYFTRDQKKIWRQLSVILKEHNLFSDMNGPLLEELAWWQWVIMEMRERIIGPHKIITTGDAGKNPYTPEFGIVKQATEQKLKICSKLGLSSVDAARIGSMMAGTAKKKSKLEELLD